MEARRLRRRIFKAVLNRPLGLAWAVCAGTCMHGPEGASVQQCTGATRHVPEPLVEGQGEVAGLLHRPLAGGVGGDSAQMHPAGAMLDEYQDVQSSQQHRVRYHHCILERYRQFSQVDGLMDGGRQRLRRGFRVIETMTWP